MRLRRAREARALSLRQLASDTRISTAVLEALEKGWRDRLPEPTYLRSMLSLLEQHLELPAGTLQAVVPPRLPQAGSSLADPRLRRFSPTAIELFSTWQGCLLYGVLCLGLIYGLNRQQQQLASRGLLSLRPLPPLPAAADRPDQGSPDPLRQRLLRAYPDVRPLERAGRGQALALIRQELRAPVRPGSVPGSGTASGARPAGTAPNPDAIPQPPATRP
jgi:transcriptional regulator with XRE-family HTH domain